MKEKSKERERKRGKKPWLSSQLSYVGHGGDKVRQPVFFVMRKRKREVKKVKKKRKRKRKKRRKIILVLHIFATTAQILTKYEKQEIQIVYTK